MPAQNTGLVAAAQVKMKLVSSQNNVYNLILEPPQNVALTATGPDKLEISWSPPPGSRATLYIVIFEGVTHPVQPSRNLVMELDSLTTFTRYTCCVAAKTRSGASRMACDTQTTLELGKKLLKQKM